MRLQSSDWGVLRKRICIAGGIVLLLISLLGSAYQYHHHQYVALQQVKSAYNNAHQQLQLAQQEQADSLRYLPQYQQLADVGFIGEERRQQWVERLRESREQYGLFEMDYAIGQQEAYQLSFIKNPSNHRLYRSVMTLKLGLLHEGDLLRLLSGLHQNTSPLMLRSCELKRATGAEVQLTAFKENLKARCEIDWLTLKVDL